MIDKLIDWIQSTVSSCFLQITKLNFFYIFIFVQCKWLIVKFGIRRSFQKMNTTWISLWILFIKLESTVSCCAKPWLKLSALQFSRHTQSWQRWHFLQFILILSCTKMPTLPSLCTAGKLELNNCQLPLLTIIAKYGVLITDWGSLYYVLLEVSTSKIALWNKNAFQ